MRATRVIVLSFLVASCSDDGGIASNVGPSPANDAGDGSVTVDAGSEAGSDAGSDTGDDATATMDGRDGSLEGAPFNHTAQGQGTEPVWWAMTQFPAGARIDPASGTIDWTPPAPGDYPVTVRLQNDFGHADQSFVVHVP